MMKTIALIPARYAATRFPAKLMQRLGDKTVILQTYLSALSTGLFDDVAVVCDSEIIFNEITQHGGKAIMSRQEHECGTDRIAEALSHYPDAEIIVNVQGDEPFIQKEPLQKVLHLFEGEDGKDVQVASLVKELQDETLIQNPNYVKVVLDKDHNVMLFSRSVIPYHRNKAVQPVYYEHIGLYAFRREMLIRFTQMPPTLLELTEQLEGLRYLENGIKMKMAVTGYDGVKIDVPEDLERANRYLLTKE